MNEASSGTHKGVIVVGLDGSDAGVAALTWAVNEAKRTGDPVKVVTAWRWDVVAAEPLAAGNPRDVRDSAQRAQRAHVDEAIAAVGGDVLVSTQLVEGDAAAVLVEASADAGIVVIGSRGLGRVRSAILGSVSDHVVRHAHCPVLVVRPEHKHAGARKSARIAI